jgi:hypothetical protein
MEGCGLDSSGSGLGTVAGSCEHCNKVLGIFWLAEKLLASQILSSMKLVNLQLGPHNVELQDDSCIMNLKRYGGKQGGNEVSRSRGQYLNSVSLEVTAVALSVDPEVQQDVFALWWLTMKGMPTRNDNNQYCHSYHISFLNNNHDSHQLKL